MTTTDPYELRRAVLDVTLTAQQLAEGGDLGECVRALAGLRQVAADLVIADEQVEQTALARMKNGRKLMEGLGVVTVGPEQYPREAWNSQPMIRDLIEHVAQRWIAEHVSAATPKGGESLNGLVVAIRDAVLACVAPRVWWRAEGVEAAGLNVEDYRVQYPPKRRIFVEVD